MSTENKSSPLGRIGKHIRTRLVSGMLVLIPLAVTLFFLRLFFSSLTAFARPFLRPWIGELNEYVLTLIALIITVAVIYSAGLITTHIVGRQVLHWGEKWLLKMPIVKTIYASSKQVVDTVSSSTSAAFQSVAFVQFPHADSLAIGFSTGTMTGPEGQTLYRIFIATTPNPTSGFLIFLPAERIQFTDISVEDGIKMIISGGMLSPKHYRVVPPSEAIQEPAVQLPAPDAADAAPELTAP